MDNTNVSTSVQNKEYMSYEDVVRSLFMVTRKIQSEDWKPDLIMYMPRGGMMPAVYLAHALGVEEVMEINSLQGKHNSYRDILQGRNVLVVDDISDSGQTFINVMKTLRTITQGNGIMNVTFRTASVTKRTLTHFDPDYCGHEIHTTNWVEFPWEVDLTTLDVGMFIELQGNGRFLSLSWDAKGELQSYTFINELYKATVFEKTADAEVIMDFLRERTPYQNMMLSQQVYNKARHESFWNKAE